MLQQLDVACLQALRDEIRAALVEEAHEESLTLARQELADDLTRQRERLEAKAADQARLEAGLTQARQRGRESLYHEPL